MLDMNNKKNLVISEILETEQSYVNHLKEMVVVSYYVLNFKLIRFKIR